MRHGFYALFLSLTLVGFASAQAETSVTLQLKWTHQFQFAGYYAALHKGFYKEAGLDVRLLEAQPETDPVQEVIEGRADFGVGTSALLLARQKGMPVVVLSTIFQHSPYIILTRGDRGISHISDLAGRSIMLEPQADEIRAFMRKAGLSEKNIRIVPHSFQLADLINGNVDAMASYITDEPYALKKQGIPYRILNPRTLDIDFYGDNLFTSEGLIQKHRDTALRFRDASLKGWKYALEHPEEVIELILERYPTPLDREHLRFEAEQIKKLMQPDVVEIGYTNPERWERIAEMYTELGLMSDGVDLDKFIFDPGLMVSRSTFDTTISIAVAMFSVAFAVLVAFMLHNRGLKRDITQHMEEGHNLRELLQNAPFPVIVVTLSDNTVRYSNDRTLQHFGLETSELMGAHVPDFWVRPEERADFIKTAILYGSVRDWEVELKTQKGQRFWTLLSATRTHLGGEVALIVSIQDITERKRRDEELKHAHEALEQTNVRLQASLAEVERLAHTDKLTGCWNRRHLEEAANLEMGRARRYHSPLSLLVFDIDHFKRINDLFGHSAGDSVLSHLAEHIRHELRESDIFTRWGGEEFVILATNTGYEEAMQLAEKVRASIENTDFPAVGKVTISVGVSEFSAKDSLDTWFKRADDVLYQAKAAGRNRVIGNPANELLASE